MVSRDEIQAFVDQVVDRFHPDAVILFGSHAYGEPTEDSDVDLLVIMPHRGCGADMATKIRLACPRGFSMDLLVRSRAEVERRIRMGNTFLRDVTSRGIALYERSGASTAARGDSDARRHSNGTWSALDRHTSDEAVGAER